jgi:hypothetical protein
VTKKHYMSGDPEWVAICRRQRAAYFAWQAAPAGQGEAALAEYIAASAAWSAYGTGDKS